MNQPELGNYIKKLRKQNGMSQQELAQKSNLNIRSIQRIENGEVTPHPFTTKTISSVLNFDLLKEEETKIEKLEIQLTRREIEFLRNFTRNTKPVLPYRFSFLYSSIVTLAGLVLFSSSVIITLNNLSDKTFYLVLLPGVLGGIGVILLGLFLFKYQKKIEEKNKLSVIVQKILDFIK